jgi:prepilin-type N-terminal cleavage/methylation domain-containing protein
MARGALVAKNGLKTRGLTLAELLVVMVILGVLGSLAMPKFFPQKEKAVVGEAISTLHAIRMGEKSYHADTGNFLTLGALDNNATWNQIGIDNPGSSRFAYAVSFATGRATATRTSVKSVPQKYRGTTIVLVLEDGSWDEASSTHPLAPKN